MKKNNVRYLTSTLVAASLLGSAPSYALGIGEMKLKSALNQNLQAEISLLLSEGDNANDIKVNLAPNAKFDEAGIPWTVFLSKIKFEVVNQNGKAFIKLSSKEVLKEPFLDFLIEVKNAKGSLHREFTVLVDPPAAYEKIANTPVEPVVKPTSENSLPLRFIDPPTTPVNFEASTHTIQESDTLWRIASQFNQQNNVSVHRMIAAILIANPDAFQKDKAHTMIVGKTLKIPSFVETPHLFKPTQTAKIPAKKTVAAVKKVARVKNTNPLAKTKSTELTAQVSKEDKQKEITNPIKPISSEKQAEKTVSDETQKRIAEMEQQLAEMKKVVAEKDAEMAKLKTTPSIVEKVPDKPLGETAAPAMPASIAISQPAPIIAPVTTQLDNSASALPPEPAVQTVMPVPPAVAVPPVPVAPAAVKPTETLPQAIKTEGFFGISGDLYYYVAGGIGSLLLSVLGWLRLREKKKMQPVEVEIKPAVDNIPDEKTESVFSENNIDITDDVSNTVFEDLEIDNSLFEEASHEFADMISHDIDRHDVDDVLYKVDVYCSYGNFGHAETLLRDEFTKNTNAHDYALRLLKLYQDQENTEGFKEFVFELAELGKRNVPDFWAKVIEKSQRFYPEALFFMPQETETITTPRLEKNEPNITPNFDALFADDPDDKEITFGELSEQETLSASSVDDMFATPFDVSAFETNKKEPEVTLGGFTLDDMFKTEPDALEIADVKTAQMLDFGDFETLETQEFKTTVTKNVSVQPDLELEFNFGDFVVPEREIVEPETTEEVKIDFDFGEFKLDEMPVIETEKQTEESTLAFNFTDFSAPQAIELPTIEEPKMELDFGEFKLDETPVVETEKATEESTLAFNFADFSAPQAIELPEIEEPKMKLDFGEFKLDEMPVIETEKATEESTLEFNFADFSAPQAIELPEIEKPKMELDFGEFKLDEMPVIETEKATEESTLEFNFTDFSAPEIVDSAAIEEVKIDFDFGEFKLDETPAEKTEIALEEPALEMNFADFTVPEITKPEIVQSVTLEKTTPDFEFSEFVAPPEKPLLESEKVTFKPQIDFVAVSEIVEKRIQQAYAELEKVKSKDELDLSYLEMSDADFAQALADEVLKKCQIKEQLCRQKITLEVLTKLS